ncbi:MAG: DUF1549 domain-containing protein, partial [Planctomycetota bacterium]
MLRFSSSTAGVIGLTLVVGSSLLLSGRTESVSASDIAAGLDANVENQSLQRRFFESKIRPLLIQRCYECHSGENQEGGLRLDHSDSLTVGGDSGQPVIAGGPDESLLMAAVHYDGLEMPPDEQLSRSDIALLNRWIAEGAYWPSKWENDSNVDSAKAEKVDWWASKPLRATTPDWSSMFLSRDTNDPLSDDGGSQQASSPCGAIDLFIDQELQEVDLTRAPRAPKTKLIRRLSLDLLGIPPTKAQVDAFLCDTSPLAYQKLVDRTLADPAYGERVGRHWLDLVRFAESDGYRQDAFRPSAHRYRDWVIDVLNQGLPYDKFVMLQIAGDELRPGDEGALAATGFFRLGIYEYNQRDAEGQWKVILGELTDVTADVFMATGLACAKCHDHKFDPIPRSDYYNFRSVFEPLTFRDIAEATPGVEDIKDDRETAIRLLDELNEIEGDALQAAADQAVELFPLEVQAMYRKSKDQRDSYESQIAYLVDMQAKEKQSRDAEIAKVLGKEIDKRRQTILQSLDELGIRRSKLRAWMTVEDAHGPTRPTRLPGRKTGREFRPSIPEVFGGAPLAVAPPPENPSSSGRRSALARWLVSNENPITARVIVNRIWQYHFGRGLVETPNDFGALGKRPTHPELLD